MSAPRVGPPPGFWDARYADDEFAYGTQANDFIVEYFSRIPPGKVLCLGAGEGRNAVFLASKGYQVVALDGSVQGAKKTTKLAAQMGVLVETVTADLNGYDLGRGQWSGIISIWCHLPSQLRRAVHRRVVDGLAVGGVFLLEAYTPAQLAYGTGGPPLVDMLCARADLLTELAGLDFAVAHEIEREVAEGRHHHGKSAVVQLVGLKV